MLSTTSSPTDQILEATSDLREQLLQHPLYELVTDLDSLRVFMRHHAFAVLDFMWLLKRLQQDLCCTKVPWLPPTNPELARFINEIVLGEESDEDGQGGHSSHFELYIQAMSDVAADAGPVSGLIEKLRSGASVQESLTAAHAPDSVRQFVSFNHRVATAGSTSETAAVFCFGREDIIPEMFARLLNQFVASKLLAPRLEYYIRRHIELDGDHHGPLTRLMVDRLCASPAALQSAIEVARTAISLRIELWNGVVEELSGA